MGERRSAYRILVGKPEGRRPFGTPRSGWEGNIGTDFHEIRCEGVECFDIAQDRTNGGLLDREDEPSVSIKCG